MDFPRPANLRESILLSLSYLDALGIAPTAYEVWCCLPRTQASLSEVYLALRNDPLLQSVTHRDRGHLSLRDTDHIDEITLSYTFYPVENPQSAR